MLEGEGAGTNLLLPGRSRSPGSPLSLHWHLRQQGLFILLGMGGSSGSPLGWERQECLYFFPHGLQWHYSRRRLFLLLPCSDERPALHWAFSDTTPAKSRKVVSLLLSGNGSPNSLFVLFFFSVKPQLWVGGYLIIATWGWKSRLPTWLLQA